MQSFQGQKRSSNVFNASALRCVKCGHRLSEDLHKPKTRSTCTCSKCGCDLGNRPPMSYARMEGFLGELAAPESDEPVAEQSWDHCLQERLTERWVASAFFGILLVILIAGILKG